MYIIVQDRNMETEVLVWRGGHFAIGMQTFNSHRNSCEKGDFEVLELIRGESGCSPVIERSFRFK